MGRGQMPTWVCPLPRRFRRVREAFGVRAYSAAFSWLKARRAVAKLGHEGESGGIRAHSKGFARFARTGSAVPFIPMSDANSFFKAGPRVSAALTARGAVVWAGFGQRAVAPAMGRIVLASVIMAKGLMGQGRNEHFFGAKMFAKAGRGHNSYPREVAQVFNQGDSSAGRLKTCDTAD